MTSPTFEDWSCALDYHYEIILKARGIKRVPADAFLHDAVRLHFRHYTSAEWLLRNDILQLSLVGDFPLRLEQPLASFVKVVEDFMPLDVRIVSVILKTPAKLRLQAAHEIEAR